MFDEYLLKICIIGLPGELKTKMIPVFVERKFHIDYPSTLGVSIVTKEIKVDGTKVKLILVNTAGQEFFGKLRPSYYRGASAAIITFDKGDRDTFKAVKKWYKELWKHTGSVPIALVGFITKSEPKASTLSFLKSQKQLKKVRKWIDWGNNDDRIHEEITLEEGRSLAEKLGLSYYETRPTDKKIIEGIFHDLTLQVLRRKVEECS